MSYFIKLLVIALLALVLHILLGWAWTIGAGVAAGLWIGRGGWHLGAASVGMEWLVIVGYDFIVAPRAVHLMTANLGSLLGNLPFFVVVALTLLIGALLGMVGGAAGTQLARILRHRNAPRAANRRTQGEHSAPA